MKFLKILVATSVALSSALTPVLASAQSTSSDNKPAAGPLAGRALTGTEIPAGAIIIGGLVLLGGVVIAVIGSSDAKGGGGITVPPSTNN